MGDSLLVYIIILPEMKDTYILIYNEHEQKHSDSCLTADYCAIQSLGIELFSIRFGSARQGMLKLTSSLC